jgi:hypothetical protein
VDQQKGTDQFEKASLFQRREHTRTPNAVSFILIEAAMRGSLSLLAITLCLAHRTDAFLTVQKRDRPVAFGNNAAVPNGQTPAHNNNKPLSNDHPTRASTTFLAAHGISSANINVNPFALANDPEFTPWLDEEDDSVDLSYSTILMACAFTMALGFGLGYGT